MKNYEEMARCVLEARDEHNRKVKLRQAKIKKYAPVVSSFCFAVLLGFGVWHHLNDIPRIPTQPDTIEDTTGNTEPITEKDTRSIATERQTEQNTTGEKSTQYESTEVPTMNSETEIVSETDQQTEHITEDQQIEPITDTPSVIITDPFITEPEITDPPTESNTDAPATTETPSTDVPDEEPNKNPNPLHWDEMTINQQYNMAEFGDPLQFYHTAEKEVSADLIGDFICMAYMSGYDFYSDTYYHCETKAYKVLGEAELEVIAIQFEEDDRYYLYDLAKKNDTDIDG